MSSATEQKPTSALGPLPSEVSPPTSGSGPQPPARARLAYILAASHSGSTLFAMLLGAHPELCTVGELKATNLGDATRYRCSCRQLISECSFWNQISHSMAQRGVPQFSICDARTSIFEMESRYVQRLLAPLQRGPFLECARDAALALSPRWRMHLLETTRRNLALIQALHETTGAGWIVDSSKVALRLKYLQRIPELEIKVLRLIRDGRAVSLTYMDDWNFADAADPALRNGGTGEYRPSVRGSMEDAAREWRRSNESADCLVARLPRSQWIEVRYEDICAQPVAALQKICRFLEIDPAKINLDFRSREQHVVGNGMRLDSSSEIRLDERWKTHLSVEDLKTFDRVAGSLNRKYGYV